MYRRSAEVVSWCPSAMGSYGTSFAGGVGDGSDHDCEAGATHGRIAAVVDDGADTNAAPTRSGGAPTRPPTHSFRAEPARNGIVSLHEGVLRMGQQRREAQTAVMAMRSKRLSNRELFPGRPRGLVVLGSRGCVPTVRVFFLLFFTHATISPRRRLAARAARRRYSRPTLTCLHRAAPPQVLVTLMCVMVVVGKHLELSRDAGLAPSTSVAAASVTYGTASDADAADDLNLGASLGHDDAYRSNDLTAQLALIATSARAAPSAAPSAALRSPAPSAALVALAPTAAVEAASAYSPTAMLGPTASGGVTIAAPAYSPTAMLGPTASGGVTIAAPAYSPTAMLGPTASGVMTIAAPAYSPTALLGLTTGGTMAASPVYSPTTALPAAAATHLDSAAAAAAAAVAAAPTYVPTGLPAPTATALRGSAAPTPAPTPTWWSALPAYLPTMVAAPTAAGGASEGTGSPRQRDGSSFAARASLPDELWAGSTSANYAPTRVPSRAPAPPTARDAAPSASATAAVAPVGGDDDELVLLDVVGHQASEHVGCAPGALLCRRTADPGPNDPT